MKHRFAAGALAFAVVAFATAAADEGLKSGLDVGKRVSPFHPLNVTGPDAGEKQCLV